MMIPVGRLTIWAADGSIAWEGMAEATEQLIQSQTLTDNIDVKELEIGGKVVAAAAAERKEDLDLVVYPVAGDGEGENVLANARAAVEKPAPMTVCTLTSDIPAFAGTYNYVGGNIQNADGALQHNMKLKRWNGAALAPAA